MKLCKQVVKIDVSADYLNKEIALCRQCDIAKTRTKSVPGEGAEMPMNIISAFSAPSPGTDLVRVFAISHCRQRAISLFRSVSADIYFNNLFTAISLSAFDYDSTALKSSQ